MQKSVVRLSLILASCVGMAACGHNAETAEASAPKSHYVLQSQRGAEQSTSVGFVSRYQREIIVADATDYTSSPTAQNFDHIMDHLETLMAPQIEENNRIAMVQAQQPGYRF